MLGARLATLLKEYGWVLNLVFIALAGYYVAGASNAVVGRLIRVVPGADDVPLSSGSAGRPKLPASQDLEAINRRNLFAALVENLQPVNAAAQVDLSAVSGRSYNYADLKKCTVGMTVRATLVADGAPEWSMAVLVPNTSREPEVYSILEGRNHIADDAYLVDVLFREVVVRRRDHFEKCVIEGMESAGDATPTAINTPPSEAVAAGGDAPPSTPEPPGGGVQKLSGSDYEVDGSYLDQTLANLNEVATQARIVPSFKDGKANGFKMFSIKPGSIYSKIGMQNGDVIQKVNGFEINSPEKGLELYSKLRDSTAVTLEVQRRGQPMTLNYRIRR